MIRSQLVVRGVIGGMAIVMASTAQAAVLTFVFEGHVTNVSRNDPPGTFPVVALEDKVVYTFSFDSDAPSQTGLDTYASYHGLASSLAIEGIAFDSAVPIIKIQHPLDLFDVSVIHNPSQVGLAGYYVDFRLSDQAESNALTSVDLPLVPYTVEPFASRGFSTGFFGSGYYLDLAGRIDEFYAVPEPTTLLCVLASGTLLARRNRRRS